MTLRIFLAGASGVIGRVLVPLLLADGHHVTGTTRRPDRAAALAEAGAFPTLLDIFDADAVMRAVTAARPDVIIQQLTDLPADLSRLDAAARARNADLRIRGTANLAAAARAAGTRRIVAQSIAFAYAPGPLPYREADPLDPAQTGVIALEQRVLASPEGIVLRYGRLYGPGTWSPESAPKAGPLHVRAAAEAARRAVTQGAPGIYNIAEDDGTLTVGKARAAFGFDARAHRDTSR
jgi:nucleoside-diphosphate-sugar epimerase